MNKITTFNIPFSRISTTTPFEVLKDEVKFSGDLIKKDGEKVLCSGQICGFVLHYCDRCGKDLKLAVCEKFELILSDGIFEDFNHEVVDVIEFFDGKIDIDEILHSEIEAYKSGYFYCDNCKNL